MFLAFDQGFAYFTQHPDDQAWKKRLNHVFVNITSALKIDSSE